LHWVATRKINSVIFSRYGIFLISDRPTLGAKEYVTNTAMCAAIWQRTLPTGSAVLRENGSGVLLPREPRRHINLNSRQSRELLNN